MGCWWSVGVASGWLRVPGGVVGMYRRERFWVSRYAMVGFGKSGWRLGEQCPVDVFVSVSETSCSSRG